MGRSPWRVRSVVGGGVENFLRGRQGLKTYQCAEESSRSAVDVLAWAETMR